MQRADKHVEAEIANAMTEGQILDIIFEAQGNDLIEIYAKDPFDLDTTGVYLEVVKLDDYEVVVRDRWHSIDGDRHIVSTSDIYGIYRLLLDQVEEAN